MAHTEPFRNHKDCLLHCLCRLTQDRVWLTKNSFHLSISSRHGSLRNMFGSHRTCCSSFFLSTVITAFNTDLFFSSQPSSLEGYSPLLRTDSQNGEHRLHPLSFRPRSDTKCWFRPLTNTHSCNDFLYIKLQKRFTSDKTETTL